MKLWLRCEQSTWGLRTKEEKFNTYRKQIIKNDRYTVASQFVSHGSDRANTTELVDLSKQLWDGFTMYT